ncbi:MAG TPA: hypothetical protein VF418_07805 [Sphingomonadaceae bacterium]
MNDGDTNRRGNALICREMSLNANGMPQALDPYLRSRVFRSCDALPPTNPIRASSGAC